jgi:hypothetical protein
MVVVGHVGGAGADVVAREPSENDDAFMARVAGPSAELAQPVVRSTEIVKGRLSLIAFENVEDHARVGRRLDSIDYLVGHLLVETSPGQYEHVRFFACEEDGGTPELLAAFFARTVKGGGRDLGVLVHFDVHPGGGYGDASCYGAWFFRVEMDGPRIFVCPVTELNRKFDKFNTCDVRGLRSKFRTVREIKKLLTHMGIEQ